jgi:hypothetical protein
MPPLIPKLGPCQLALRFQTLFFPKIEFAQRKFTML